MTHSPKIKDYLSLLTIDCLHWLSLSDWLGIGSMEI